MAHFATSIRFLVDGAASICEKLCDRKAQVVAPLHEPLEAREVSAAHIGCAFNQMPANQASSNLVEVLVAVPAVPPHTSCSC